MKILSVTQYKGSTFKITFEGQPDIFVNIYTVEKLNLRADMDIPESGIEQIKSVDLERKARTRAMHLLTARDYSFVELFGKLSANYPHELCLDVCRYMAEMDYINDRRYAEKLARELFEVKKYGIIKAKFEMKRRGLTPNVIEEALEPYADDSSTLERLEELVEKKYERYLTDAKGVQKVKSALARAGYSYDSINAVLNLYDLEFEKQ